MELSAGAHGKTKVILADAGGHKSKDPRVMGRGAPHQTPAEDGG